ncbi:MAG: hypothetical protein L0Z62_48370 [Gemmataceae bacterium]|nr:hypothetical protein [Gemmataceae bacterium]
MAHVYLSLVGMVVVATLAWAEPGNEPPAQTEAATSDTTPVIKLLVRPIPYLPAALKYQLLPDPRVLTPDNAAPHWLRARHMVSQHRPGLTDQQYRWLSSETPLQDLPRQEVRQFLDRYRTVLQVAALAARCQRCDWDPPRLATHSMRQVLVPEVQDFRDLVHVLRIQIRLEMAEGNFDKALHTLQTGFALAKHIGEGPSLLHALFGTAIAAIMTERAEELIQLPEAPNLYWALTMLPHPFLDERKSLYGEVVLMYRTSPLLQEVPTTPMKPEQAEALMEAALREPGGLRISSTSSLQAKLFLISRVAGMYSEAKRALLAQGLASEQVETMPAVQAVALHLQRRLQQQLDDWLKWIHVPYWQAAAGLEKAEKRFQANSSRTLEEFHLGLSLPEFAKVRTNLARMDRRLAGLRCVEAIRLYAATHDGRLPQTLSALTDVPLPFDPVTGKSFELCYRLQEDQAVFEVPPPIYGSFSRGRRYVLTPAR